MSSAPREAKWAMCSRIWAGQAMPMQRWAASPSEPDDVGAAFRAGLRHDEGLLRAGSSRFDDLDDLGNHVARPLDHDRIPDPDILLRISSSLWRVARLTVTPPTRTGFMTATGVRTPVRPTWTTIVLDAPFAPWTAANLQATPSGGCGPRSRDAPAGRGHSP